MADKASIKLSVDTSDVNESMKLLTRRMQGIRKALESASPAQREYGESLARSLGYMSDMEIEGRKLLGIDKQRLQEAKRLERVEEKRLATEKKVTSELGKQTQQQQTQQRQQQRGGGNRAGRFNAIAMNAAYAVDDFASSQGSFGQRLRGAGNNISAALSFAGPAGLAAGVGVNVLAQVADAFGVFDSIDEAFGFSTQKQAEAADELLKAAEAQRLAVKEAEKAQAEMLSRIAEPLNQLDAAQALSPQGRERAAREALAETVVGNRDEMEQNVADAQARLDERDAELGLLRRGREGAAESLAQAQRNFEQWQEGIARNGGIPLPGSGAERAVQRAQAEVDRIDSAIGSNQRRRDQAALDLETAQEPLRRAGVAEEALPDLMDALDAINGISAISAGADVEGIDNLVRLFDQASSLAQSGDLEGAQAAVDSILQSAPQVAGEATAAANAERSAAAAAQFRATEGGRFEEDRRFAELTEWLTGGRQLVADGELTERELGQLARERFASGIDLSTDPVLDSRAAIGVSSLRSGGGELSRLLSGEDGSNRIERVNEEQLQMQRRMVELLEEQGLVLAE